MTINTTGITKYKPSVIYKKPFSNFYVLLHSFHCAKLSKDLQEQIQSSKVTTFSDPQYPIHPQQDLFCKNH